MDLNLLAFIAIGFFAQVIDGALGMAYGVISTTFLLSLGLAPAAASASVHTSEIFTTLVSGLSHLRFGNVDRYLFRKLLIPGLIGGVAGAYVLTALPVRLVRPLVALYLILMGVLILSKAFSTIVERKVRRGLIRLALAGGFLDAIGGGGWGPLVTSSLVARGNNPRLTVGSVNAAEFFVTTAQVATFVTLIGLHHWKVVVGLMIGGIVAAPLAALTVRKLPHRLLLILVGFVIILLSIRTLFIALR